MAKNDCQFDVQYHKVRENLIVVDIFLLAMDTLVHVNVIMGCSFLKLNWNLTYLLVLLHQNNNHVG